MDAGKGKRRQSIGALLLGVYEAGGALRYAGRVGSGFSDAELERLSTLLGPLERRSSPFTSGQKPPRGASFCEPALVAEVEFTEWTSAGSLRHPVLQGPARGQVREGGGARGAGREPRGEQEPERQPAEVEGDLRGERAPRAPRRRCGGHALKLSNLAKVLYQQSGFTKRELIDYYVGVAPVLQAHLEGRPLTVTRWPDGVEGKSFFQKQAPAHRPAWVRTATVESSSKPIDYTLADDLATLVWLANLAAIELHTPLARAEAMERPTALVFDLDPGAPATIVECCRVALMLQGMFENLGLQSFAKTSGSKGLQMYVPLNSPEITYAQTKPFARTVAELLESADPDLVVSQMTKTRRTGKVLIDWSQNDSKKTTVCVYSLRATPRPTASTPLEWHEVRSGLEGGDPARLAFEAKDVLRRVQEKGTVRPRPLARSAPAS